MARERSGPARSAKRGRVLVVDDEPLIAASLVRLLGSEHEVRAVSSAYDVIALVEAGERFDLILCDVRMPNMNGLELYDKLAEVAPELTARMVFFTGAAFGADVREFFGRVSNELLEKPFDPKALRALVRRYTAPEEPKE